MYCTFGLQQAFCSARRDCCFARRWAADEACAPGCASVHTFGMGYAIELVFLDPLGRVLHVARSLRPWRVASQPGAAAVLELMAGGAAAHQLYPGAVLDAALSGIGG